MKKYAVLLLILSCAALFFGCSAKPIIESVELSEVDDQKISVLIPPQSAYGLYEFNFESGEYSTLSLLCQIYSYDELMQELPAGNCKVDDTTKDGLIGISSDTDGTVRISCNYSGIISRYTVDLNMYEEFSSETFGTATNTQIIENSDGEYILYSAIFADGDIQAINEGPFDLEALAEYPFYYTVKCVFE